MRTVAAALAAAVMLVAPAAAHASQTRERLSKREARAQGYKFASNFVSMLDVQRKVGTNMEPAKDCYRYGPYTVRCQYTATLYTGKTIHSHVTVNRQKDGLLGYNLPLDILANAV